MPSIEVGTIKAADGVTDLYYRIIKPADFDPVSYTHLDVYKRQVTTRSAGSALGLSNGIFVTETLNAPSVTLAHEIGHTLHLKDTYPANTGGSMDYPPGGLISSEVDEIWRNAYEK